MRFRFRRDRYYDMNDVIEYKGATFDCHFFCPKATRADACECVFCCPERHALRLGTWCFVFCRFFILVDDDAIATYSSKHSATQATNATGIKFAEFVSGDRKATTTALVCTAVKTLVFESGE